MNIQVIGVPLHSGCRVDGPQFAPAILLPLIDSRCVAPHKLYRRNELDIYDITYNFGSYRLVTAVAECLRRAVSESLADGCFPLIIGGDHALAWGSIAGVMDIYSDAHIVYIDAHGDFNTPDCSPTGNIHGMHLSFLTGMADTAKYAPDFNHRILPTDALHFYATRALDDGEKILAAQHHLDITGSGDIARRGIDDIVAELDAKLSHIDSAHVHLSFDVDSIDPAFAPGTGVREPEGITVEQAAALIGAVARCGKLVSADFVEYNPRLDTADRRTCDIMTAMISVLASNLSR